ncbi:MAG TPA: response regulator [Moraxellaceae bacterium]|nr:response regulator [Moraxellaceae bacterium]
MIKIQLVDDEPNILRSLQRVLRPLHLEIHAFTDPQEALLALTENEYAVIISDYKMPSLNGITYLQFAKQRQPCAMRMVLSAFGDRESMLQAINQAEIYRFLSKPWEDYEIESAVKGAVDLYLLRVENQQLLVCMQNQQTALDRQEQALRRLEAESPGITKVMRDERGMVLLDVGEAGDGNIFSS